MNKSNPLGQGLSIGAFANANAKLQKNFDMRPNILDGLIDFAFSVPDFRRTGKGNIRHRLGDIIYEHGHSTPITVAQEKQLLL